VTSPKTVLNLGDLTKQTHATPQPNRSPHASAATKPIITRTNSDQTDHHTHQQPPNISPRAKTPHLAHQQISLNFDNFGEVT
jgi:hypothetical protein